MMYDDERETTGIAMQLDLDDDKETILIDATGLLKFLEESVSIGDCIMDFKEDLEEMINDFQDQVVIGRIEEDG